jgi:hypothetical protein
MSVTMMHIDDQDKSQKVIDTLMHTTGVNSVTSKVAGILLIDFDYSKMSPTKLMEAVTKSGTKAELVDL